MKRSKLPVDPNNRHNDARFAVRFVVVTVGALAMGYVAFLLLYLTLGPILSA